MLKQNVMKKRKSRDVLASSTPENIVLNIFFILLTIVFLYPVLVVFGVSFTSSSALTEYGYAMIPKEFSLEAYKLAVQSGDIVRAYINTIGATVIGTFLGVSIMLLYAYPLSRKNFKHRKFYSFYAYFTTIFGGGMVPWYIICTQLLHINNTFWALFLPSLVSVWNIIVLRTFITTNIPDELLEAARIDGCGEFRIFVSMVIPLSKAGTATIALFTALAFWNDYYLPMMLITDPKYYNLQYYLQLIFLNIEALTKNTNLSAANAQAMKIPAETTRFAMCVLTMGPILFVYPFFQKYFVKGLTIGSVKG
ncbi:MAG: carbohydrate ABC transporter permease [Clostridiales bacterium]|nr:carbohydrate ABC transporter permease [Clostridiales bacterium]